MNRLYLLFLCLTVHLSVFGQTSLIVDAIDLASFGPFPEVEFDGKKFIYLPQANLLADKIDNSIGNMSSVIKEGFYGVVNKQGKILAPFEYDDIELKGEYQGQWYEGITYDYEFIITKREGKYGVIDVSGRVISHPQYEGITIINKDLIGIKQQGKWGWIDAGNGRIIQQPVYDEVRKCYLTNGAVAIYQGDKEGMAKADGTIVIPPKYTFLSNIYTYTASYIAYLENDQCGVFTSDGKVLTPPQFEAIESLREVDLIKVKQGGKVGAIDLQGNWVIPADFDRIDDFIKGLAIVKKDGKPAVINEEGRLVVPFGYEEIEFQNARGQAVFSNGGMVEAPTPHNTKLSDEVLKQRMREKNLVALPYTIYVRKDAQINRFDWSGKPLLSNSRFTMINPFLQAGKSYYHVFSDGLYGVYDAVGKEILPVKYRFQSQQYAMSMDYSEGRNDLSDLPFVPVYDGDKLGLFDLEKKRFIIPVANQRITWIDKRFIAVNRERQGVSYVTETALYDSTGKCIKDFDANVIDYQALAEKLLLLKRVDGSLLLMNAEGRIIYENAAWKMRAEGFDLPEGEMFGTGTFENGLLKISGDEGSLFIDTAGREKRFDAYTAVGSFHKGLAFVVKNTGEDRYKYGVIDVAGQEVLPPLLDQVNTVYDCPDLLLVQQNNQFGLWNREGKFALDMEYDDIEIHSSQKYIRIVKNGKMGLASRTGEIVLAPKYEEIAMNYEGDEGVWPVLVRRGAWYEIVDKEGNTYSIKANKRIGY